MAQRDIVTEKHDNCMLDLVAAYCAACAETARLSDRYAGVERHRPYDEEELEAAKTEFDKAWRDIEQIADDVAACLAGVVDPAEISRVRGPGRGSPRGQQRTAQGDLVCNMLPKGVTSYTSLTRSCAYIWKTT